MLVPNRFIIDYSLVSSVMCFINEINGKGVYEFSGIIHVVVCVLNNAAGLPHVRKMSWKK